jgi:hypothetical protein
MDHNGCDQSGNLGSEQEHRAEPAGMPILAFTLPTGVVPKHGRYYLLDRVTGEDGKRRKVWHPLTRVSEGAIPFWRAYYRLTKADPEFMAGVFLAFLEEGLPEKVRDGDLTQGTADKYEEYILLRLVPYCGHMHRTDINSAHVARYLAERKKAGAPIAANRERAAWSTTNEWAMGKGWLTSNPCRGVRRNKERGSLEYVQHEPLVSALDRASVIEPELYCLMGIAYLLGSRQTDLRLAEESQITVDPVRKCEILRIVENKTRKTAGKVNEHEITPTVRLLLDKAREHKEAVARRYELAAEKLERRSQKRRAAASRAKAAAVRATPHIFVSHRGLPWSEWGLQSALRRFGAGFQFRQLRPKAETDKPGTLGHSGQMQRLYTRRRRLKAVK